MLFFSYHLYSTTNKNPRNLSGDWTGIGYPEPVLTVPLAFTYYNQHFERKLPGNTARKTEFGEGISGGISRDITKDFGTQISKRPLALVALWVWFWRNLPN